MIGSMVWFQIDLKIIWLFLWSMEMNSISVLFWSAFFSLFWCFWPGFDVESIEGFYAIYFDQGFDRNMLVNVFKTQGVHSTFLLPFCISRSIFVCITEEQIYQTHCTIYPREIKYSYSVENRSALCANGVWLIFFPRIV